MANEWAERPICRGMARQKGSEHAERRQDHQTELSDRVGLLAVRSSDRAAVSEGAMLGVRPNGGAGTSHVTQRRGAWACVVYGLRGVAAWAHCVAWTPAEVGILEISRSHSACGASCFSCSFPELDGDVFVEDCRRPREFFRESWNAPGLQDVRHFGCTPKVPRAPTRGFLKKSPRQPWTWLALVQVWGGVSHFGIFRPRELGGEVCLPTPGLLLRWQHFIHVSSTTWAPTSMSTRSDSWSQAKSEW